MLAISCYSALLKSLSSVSVVCLRLGSRAVGQISAGIVGAGRRGA